MAGAPRNAAVIARTKLNMNAMRMRTCETPTRICELGEAVLPRERDQALHAEPDQRDRHDRQAGEQPDDPPADELADRQPRDDDHRATSRVG